MSPILTRSLLWIISEFANHNPCSYLSPPSTCPTVTLPLCHAVIRLPYYFVTLLRGYPITLLHQLNRLLVTEQKLYGAFGRTDMNSTLRHCFPDLPPYRLTTSQLHRFTASLHHSSHRHSFTTSLLNLSTAPQLPHITASEFQCFSVSVFYYSTATPAAWLHQTLPR